ncbi:oxidoreductase, zinc-binding dehydrogenase family, putative [Talaromyces stipitatus ATCC 10500]|uniref:Oxidoreductase, zinc-binding dehydrogenase family, putative n=1 Tax=Talaromyces stipitatus (strain ATCC 10500 / CBS 375.48 / QM 6759 / NRRL 1006) TaxID=441959 RepID=B8M201_TALSN|nr:oxidoreductase, zinc-binding dehydrogenase family, putative [Talaromyces stipitatus ATCC 10500]EED21379.1 oxidoreductase, zinc-binding dehydrogenase family, putative [Talaromyces stipitatus ATCC 10500]
MATTTTTWITTTDSISHKHDFTESRNDSYLRSSSSTLRPLPLTEEQNIIKKEAYTETAEIKTTNIEQHSVPVPVVDKLAATQNALLLHAIKEKYTLVTDHAIPSIHHQDEILIEVSAIGLNPIDWKAPAFNFGIPSLPWVFGRDLAGKVIKTSSSSSRLQVGDLVLVPSTDYRDIRKAAFQEYAVTTHYNAAKIPPTTSIHGGASIGVAYVAAALALGVSFGLDFGLARSVPGPDLRTILKSVNAQDIPEDVRPECLPSSEAGAERVKKGDWIAIWGASTTTGYIALQLAKLCGLKVICIADIARHGQRLHALGADILVDRHDTNRAVDIIRGVTNGQLRFGIDIVGRDTATILEKALSQPHKEGGNEPQSHLLGLTGSPKEKKDGIVYHTVPIKIFHESPQVGEGLVKWLENLLEYKALTPPEVVIRDEGGLGGINDALDLLRSGEVSGKRIVVDLRRGDVKQSTIQ